LHTWNKENKHGDHAPMLRMQVIWQTAKFVTATICISREWGMTVRASKPVPNKTFASQKITFSTNDSIMYPSRISPASQPTCLRQKACMLSPKLKQIVHPTTVYSEAQVSICFQRNKMPFFPRTRVRKLFEHLKNWLYSDHCKKIQMRWCRYRFAAKLSRAGLPHVWQFRAYPPKVV
jgi:hypothetical protein